MPSDSAAFQTVPIELTVSVGTARPSVKELLTLDKDAVLLLDRSINDPVEIFIGDRLIARGELQESEENAGQLAIRLTEVCDPGASAG